MTRRSVGLWIGYGALWFGLVVLTSVLVAAQFAAYMVVLLLLAAGGAVVLAMTTGALLSRRAARTPAVGVQAARVRGPAKPSGKREEAQMEQKTVQARLIPFLREVDVFQSLTDHELGMIASVCAPKTFSAGDFLAREGSRGDHLFIIMKGQVRVSSKSEGDQLTVRIVRGKESVPLASILEPPLLITTAEAMETVETLAIPRAMLLRICELQPMLGVQVYKATAGVLARRYRAMLQQVTGQLEATLEYMGHTHT